MKTILETTQLEFDNNDYLVDLVKLDNDRFFIEIEQTIFDKNIKRKIKIDSSILSDLIKVLQNYHAKLPKESKFEIKHLTDVDQEKIVQSYLKGVTIKNLAMQYGQDVALIEMILRNKDLEIVENTLPKQKFWRNNKRRKRSR